jgi:Tol biopolymer transport system component
MIPGGAWSAARPTNGLITLAGNSGAGEQIFTVGPTGKGLALIPLPPGASSANDPVWSPSGAQIAFYSTGAATQLWVINRGGSISTAVTVAGAFSQIDHPTWSPDGKTIAFAAAAGPGASFAIWSVHSNGEDVHALTTVDTAPFATGPAWSPRGTKIAFVSNDGQRTNGRPDPTGIYVMNPDGTGIHRLTPTGPGAEQDPAWSPDGTWLAFASLDPNWETTHVSNIDRIRADGTGVRQLTKGGFWVGNPVVSPDQRKVVFYRYRGTNVNPHVFIMSSDGTGLRQLLTTEGAPFSWANG